MALYEYQCTDCKTRFELRRAMRDSDAPTKCPQCHGEHVTRQVSLFMSFRSADDTGTDVMSGGCGCGGSCSCGAHSHN